MIHERFREYDSNYCWQYHIRLQNREKDLKDAGLTEKQVSALRVKDFEFEYVDKTDRHECAEVEAFIKRHEWLGDRLPKRPTHRFSARLRHNGALAGVIIMAVPNTFSSLLGDKTQDIEKLISRGACISWSPKNLGSWLVMNAIRWMVQNTGFRLFTAYSDPEARELGTIYQSCNFVYCGQSSGTVKQYFDPKNPGKGWFCDRDFRKPTMYYKYAENLGVNREEWKKYMKKESPLWDAMPSELARSIKLQEAEKNGVATFGWSSPSTNTPISQVPLRVRREGSE